MRYAVLLALFICSIGNESVAAEATNQARLELIAHRQQALIEKTFSISYGGYVGISFGVPEYMSQANAPLQEAWYVPTLGKILVHPKFEQTLGTAAVDSAVSIAIRHELGHAYADAIGKKLGFTRWPPKIKDPPQFMAAGFDSIIGYVMLNEGIGRTFERLGKPYANDCDFDNYVEGTNVYLPTGRDDRIWLNADILLQIFYEGGYCVVNPIISRNPQAGIEYLLTHKLTFPDWDLRTAVRDYVSAALYHLPQAD